MERRDIMDNALPGHLANASLMDLKPYMAISMRAYNICKRDNLLQLSKLLAFYIQEKDFLKLNNAGKKTAKELEYICQWLLSQPDTELIEALPINEETQYLMRVSAISPSNFSTIQIRLLNAYIHQWRTALSVRSQTALSNFLRGNIDYAALHHFFFEKQIQASQIKNVGKKSFQEILEFVEHLRTTAEGIMQKPDEDLEVELAANQICEAFSLTHFSIKPYLSAIQAKRFPFFHFLQDLILNHFFDKRQAYILHARSGWFHTDEILGLDIIGQQIGITRERVRQIASKIEEEFLEKIAFFIVQRSMLLQITGDRYALDTSLNLLVIRRQLVDDINHIEGTNFSPRFFALVFAALYADTYRLFGRQFEFFQNEYLLRRDLLDGFDAVMFVTNMENLTRERIKEDFSLDLEGHLLKFLKSGQPNKMLAQARDVSIDLLIMEFSEQVRLELPNEVIICRNTRQQVWEYALEALETIGSPAKLVDIHRAIVEKYPDFDPSTEALRGILIKENAHFISFSRTSTYGLAKWEVEFENIRGGSIRDIAEEYLQQYSEPKHCYDITDFVLRYRPNTTMKSIHTNLQYDESGRFKDFSAGFWGLAERNYDGFHVQSMSNHTFTYLKVWLNVYPDGSLEEAIEHLCKRCRVQPVQIKGWMSEKIKNGTLRLEQDKLIVIP